MRPRGNPFFRIVLVLVLLGGILVYYLRHIGGDPTDSTSPASRAVQDATGLGRVTRFQEAKNDLSLAEMQSIETALVMYEITYGRPPQDLREVIDAGMIGEGAATDAYGQPYRIERGPDGRWGIRSPGTSGIHYTGDDRVRTLTGSSGLLVPTPTPAKAPTETPRKESGGDLLERALRARVRGEEANW